MNPRKSSTSSASPTRRRRARYLGLEAAGEPVLLLAPRAWETTLRAGLDRAGHAGVRFRLVRVEGRRALAEVDVIDLPAARRAWGSLRAEGGAPAVASRRTWGTLVPAKVWLRSSARGPGPEASGPDGAAPPG